MWVRRLGPDGASELSLTHAAPCRLALRARLGRVLVLEAR